jgi:hypothetical protein
MKTVYKSLLARLKTIQELKYIDLDKGQFEIDRPPVLFPAALISIQIAKTEEINKKLQSCQLLITIRLGWDFWSDTSSLTPEITLDKSLEYFDLIEKVFDTLQGWQDGQKFNPLSRLATRDERSSFAKVTAIPFSSSYHQEVKPM